MIKKNDFVNKASDLMDEHFPKHVAKERGEAMVLVAMLLQYLMEQGVIETEEQ